MNKKFLPITFLALTLCVGVASADSTLEEVESIELDDTTSFTRTADCVAKRFTYKRESIEAGWETLCLPVTFPVSALGTDKVYTLAVAPGIDDDYTVTLSRVDTIKAGYPYAIDNTDGSLTELSVELENVTVENASSTSTIQFWPNRSYAFRSAYPYMFWGVYKETSYSAADLYGTPIALGSKVRRSSASTYKYYYTLNSEGKFEYSSTVKISPYRAVFRITCLTTNRENVDTVNVRLHEPLRDNGLCCDSHKCSLRYANNAPFAATPEKDSDGYYQLNTPQDFFWLAYNYNYLKSSSDESDYKARLNCDVDLKSLWASSDNKTSWVPIMDYSSQFLGGGHTISNLYIADLHNLYKYSCIGLFGKIDHTGMVKDLNVEVMQLTTGSNNMLAGGIAGYTTHNVVISDCHVTATDDCITTDAKFFGCIVGGAGDGGSSATDGCTVKRCTAEANIKATPCISTVSRMHVGGIAGEMGNSYCGNTVVRDCMYKGDISIDYSTISTTSTSAEYGCGGIVGHAAYGTLKDCLFYGSLSTSGTSSLPSTATTGFGLIAGVAEVEESTSSAKGLRRSSDNELPSIPAVEGSTAKPTFTANRAYNTGSDDGVAVATGNATVSGNALTTADEMHNGTTAKVLGEQWGQSVEADDSGLTEPLLALYGDASSTSHSDTLFVANVIRYDSISEAWTSKNIAMSDAEAFNAVADFTAEQFSYSRPVTSTNMFTFALPISCTVEEFGTEEVYQLTAVEDNGATLRFTKATRIEANKPYLIPAASSSEFAVNTENVEGLATSTSLGGMATTVSGVSHIATLATTEKVTSGTDGYDYYGYVGGKYVKAKKGTLKPWRTMLRVGSSSSEAKQSFSVKLGDEITGIVQTEADCSLVSALVDVYTIGGTRIRSQVSSLTALQGLPNGIYVVGGQKVVKK